MCSDSALPDLLVVGRADIDDAATWRRVCPRGRRIRCVDSPGLGGASFADAAHAIAGSVATAGTAIVPTRQRPAGPPFETSASDDWDSRVLAPLRRHAVWSAAVARAVAAEGRSFVLLNVYVARPDAPGQPWSRVVHAGLDQMTRILSADERLDALSAHTIVADEQALGVGAPVLRELIRACHQPGAPLRGQTVEIRGGTIALRRRPSVRATATLLSPPWSSPLLHEALARLAGTSVERK